MNFALSVTNYFYGKMGKAASGFEIFYKDARDLRAEKI